MEQNKIMMMIYIIDNDEADLNNYDTNDGTDSDDDDDDDETDPDDNVRYCKFISRHTEIT